MNAWEYYADFVTVPLIIALLAVLFPVNLGMVAAGIGLWTLAEYGIHRYLFHRLPVIKPAHDEHHEKPSGMTGVTSWQSAAIFFVLFWIMPTSLLIGFASGYLAYIVTHHAFHHWRIEPTSPFYAGKMRHTMHHHGDERNFGVTTSLWDRVFGTYRPWSRRARS
jgi:sterol desaturase/sphingolipid hydroxylase (fatty acid hydroxylase superfamily)